MTDASPEKRRFLDFADSKTDAIRKRWVYASTMAAMAVSDLWAIEVVPPAHGRRNWRVYAVRKGGEADSQPVNPPVRALRGTEERNEHE